MVDLNLLREPVMAMLCISNILGMLGFYVPFVFYVNMAVERGVSLEDASRLLSIIGITNTIGRGEMFQWFYSLIFTFSTIRMDCRSGLDVCIDDK